MTFLLFFLLCFGRFFVFCSLSRLGANSICRTACFLPSGRIRPAEKLTFHPAEKFGLSNGSLFARRTNSTCRKARFLPSGRIRPAERLTFCPASEFDLPNGLLFAQRRNSACTLGGRPCRSGRNLPCEGSVRAIFCETSISQEDL